MQCNIECAILDQEALDRALEGVPEEQMKGALNAAIKVKISKYNNTPQDRLGDLLPVKYFISEKIVEKCRFMIPSAISLQVI